MLIKVIHAVKIQALYNVALHKSGLVSNGCIGHEIFLYIYTLYAKYILQLC